MRAVRMWATEHVSNSYSFSAAVDVAGNTFSQERRLDIDRGKVLARTRLTARWPKDSYHDSHRLVFWIMFMEFRVRSYFTDVICLLGLKSDDKIKVNF